MAFSKITRIILYVVAGISLLVVLFFYIAPSTVNSVDELDDRVTEAANPVDMSMDIPVPEAETRDSVTPEGDTIQIELAPAPAPVEPMVVEPQSAQEVLSGWEYLVWKRTDILLVWAYILALFAMAAAVIFPLISMIQNPRRLIGFGLVLLAAGIIVTVSYVMSSDAVLEIVGYEGTANSDPSTLKMVDTVLYVTYMLAGLAIGSIFYAIISRAFK